MNIVILGAGVGGVCAAITLKQKGHQVSIFERTALPSNIGAGIVIWPNASFILDELDVLTEIENVSGCPSEMQRICNTGEGLGSLDIHSLNDKMGYGSYSILRSDLQQILLTKLTSLGVEVQYKQQAALIEERQDGCSRVLFKNGHECTADLIIGADGRMQSVARNYVNGDNKPQYQGFINWVGTLESETSIVEDIIIQDFWGVGERFGVVPVSTKKIYWAGGVAQPEVSQETRSNFRSELRAIFEHWPDPIPRILGEVAEHRINKIFVHDHDPIHCWHRDNVVLLGDSAHAPLPTSGQGACQAMEDAWHLANCLEEFNCTLENALQAYTSRRIDKTTSIIHGGRHLAKSLFDCDESRCIQRNEQSKAMDYSQMVHGMAQGWSLGLPLKSAA